MINLMDITVISVGLCRYLNCGYSDILGWLVICLKSFMGFLVPG